jgi:hypothetical protein
MTIATGMSRATSGSSWLALFVLIEPTTIPAYVMMRKSFARQRVLPPRQHHSSVTIAFADKLAVTMRRHPAGTREMGVVDMAGALRVTVRIKAEENVDGFAPIGAVGRCVKQAQIEFHVLTIIGCEHHAIRRFV